jgi:hypothetical protein
MGLFFHILSIVVDNLSRRAEAARNQWAYRFSWHDLQENLSEPEFELLNSRVKHRGGRQVLLVVGLVFCAVLAGLAVRLIADHVGFGSRWGWTLAGCTWLGGAVAVVFRSRLDSVEVKEIASVLKELKRCPKCLYRLELGDGGADKCPECGRVAQ